MCTGLIDSQSSGMEHGNEVVILQGSAVCGQLYSIQLNFPFLVALALYKPSRMDKEGCVNFSCSVQAYHSWALSSAIVNIPWQQIALSYCTLLLASKKR